MAKVPAVDLSKLGRPYHQDEWVTIYHGDCREILPSLVGISAVITDSPYELGFMGKSWDKQGVSFQIDTWRLVREACLPGAMLLSFGGTRTSHRIACAIEDAGWQIRDTICWVYASGFPKSLDISKAIDKQAGVKRAVVGEYSGAVQNKNSVAGGFNASPNADADGRTKVKITIPASTEAKLWEGYGTALKPAHEPVLFCSNPLTIELLFGIIIEDITKILEGVLQCQHLLVSDAVSSFSAIRAKLEKVQVATVHESVKISALENIGNVRYVASLFTSQNQGRAELIEMRDNSAHTDAKENGKAHLTQGNLTRAGEAGSILTGIRDIGISAITGHISENTALLWRNISEGILDQRNTFTIGTVINLITELRILKSYLIQTISTDTGNLSPSYEPIILAMKPLDGTFANNALKHGVAGLNIDECRTLLQEKGEDKRLGGKGEWHIRRNPDGHTVSFPAKDMGSSEKGRFPANLIHDGSQEVLELFPNTKSGNKFIVSKRPRFAGWREMENRLDRPAPTLEIDNYGDSGSAARYFYCAKASRRERGEGNDHPTIKPLPLMTYLCKLVKMPEYNLLLDPFCGSGTTLLACKKLGIPCIGIDSDEKSCEIAAKRCLNQV